jgi:hypothetical protein
MTPPKVAQQIEASLAVCNFLKFSLASRPLRADRQLSGGAKEIAEEDADLLYGGLLGNLP